MPPFCDACRTFAWLDLAAVVLVLGSIGYAWHRQRWLADRPAAYRVERGPGQLNRRRTAPPRLPAR